MSEIPVILLAAGQSRRMGGADKLMQDVGGMPLLRRTATRAIRVGPVIVALPPRPHDRYGALAGLNVQLIPVPEAAEGMNASLRRALAKVPAKAPAVMVMLADLPDLTTDDLTAVLHARRAHPRHLIWRGATARGKPGHPVLFDKSLFGDLSELQGDDGAQAVVRAHLDQVCLQPLPGQNALLDLDTPEDWVAWRAKQT